MFGSLGKVFGSLGKCLEVLGKCWEVWESVWKFGEKHWSLFGNGLKNRTLESEYTMISRQVGTCKYGPMGD